jgi:hypothetical protein
VTTASLASREVGAAARVTSSWCARLVIQATAGGPSELHVRCLLVTMDVGAIRFSPPTRRGQHAACLAAWRPGTRG